MRMTPVVLAVLLGCAVSYQAIAAQVPVAAHQDPRVRFVDYDPYNIVTVKAKIGRDTLIMFAPGESIKDMGGGYTDAWGVGTITARNGFYIKPTRASPNTNIHIVTNKRVYNLDMILVKTDNAISYEFIQYRYPTEEVNAQRAKAQYELAKKYLSYGDGAKMNGNYTVEGSSSIEPNKVEDNGQATYVSFPPRAEMPQIYYENEEGKEVLAPFNVKDNVIVIHAVKPKFIFRRGELVTCVFNEAYDPKGGVKSTTKTNSPRVERVIKQEAEQ
jgi:type IV secretion system protein VirB9